MCSKDRKQSNECNVFQGSLGLGGALKLIMSTQLSFEIKAQQRMVLWTSGGLKVEGNVWTAHQLPRNFKDQNKILKHLNTEWLISFIKI